MSRAAALYAEQKAKRKQIKILLFFVFPARRNGLRLRTKTFSASEYNSPVKETPNQSNVLCIKAHAVIGSEVP